MALRAIYGALYALSDGNEGKVNRESGYRPLGVIFEPILRVVCYVAQ